MTKEEYEYITNSLTFFVEGLNYFFCFFLFVIISERNCRKVEVVLVDKTTIEDELYKEVQRLNDELYRANKELNALRKKNGRQKHIISRQRATIDKLRKRISQYEDKPKYVNAKRR